MSRAADSGHETMCRLLLACGAEANAPDAQGLTPLHWAAMRKPHASTLPEPTLGNNYLDVGLQLLAAGARCNQVDELGCAPLHYAAAGAFTPLIQILKEWGADASLQNHVGVNPLHYAMAPGHLEATLTLLQGIKDIYAAIHVQVPAPRSFHLCSFHL